MEKHADVDAYLLAFPEPVRQRLTCLRQWIREEAPEAEEYIGYGMPAYRLKGTLCYFAGYGGHCGFYPSGRAIEAFEDELTTYPTSKGAIRFPHHLDLPEDLIRRIIRYRAQENRNKPETAKGRRKS